MITREKQRRNAIKAMLLGGVCLIGMTMTLMFVEIHRHQTELASQMDYKENLLLERQVAFEGSQRDAVASITKSQQALVNDWQRVAREVAATEKALDALIASKQAQNTMIVDDAMDADIAIADATIQPKPLSPEK